MKSSSTVKDKQLQIRISEKQHSLLKERAHEKGITISQLVLDQLFPPERLTLRKLISELPKAGSFGFAALHDYLVSLEDSDFVSAVERKPDVALNAFEWNYCCAMIQHEAARRGVSSPAWLSEVPPLEKPYFATSVVSLRPYLMSVSPPSFRMRNLFVDSVVGDRL